MLRSAAAYFAGIHIGVGFCVARSDGNGQCEGLRVSGRATGTDSRAFSVCIGLKTIILPNSITSIGEKAFYRCRGLHTITLPDKITNIGYEAFMDCFLLDTLITLWGSRNLVGIAIQLSDSEEEEFFVGYPMMISPEKFSGDSHTA